MHETALQFELERQACVRLRQVLLLKLQRRRDREELIDQRIMPPLKGSAAFHEPTRTGDFLKRKFRSLPEQLELVRILAETPAETSLPASPLQLKRARLAGDLNKTLFPKPSRDDPSADTGSEMTERPLCSPPETLQSAQRINARSQTKPKPNSDRSAQRHRKPVDNGPKIKKLKYHRYIAPNQKEDPPHLDSSYSEILQQQQQLRLQLQILSQQQQHHSHASVLCAPPRPQGDVLNEMKVVDLKSELRRRSLPLYGTKNDLIERLRTYKDLSGGSDTTSSPTAGGTAAPGAKRARKPIKTAAASTDRTPRQGHRTSSLTLCHPAEDTSPEDTSFNGQKLSFQPRSAAQLPADVKEEPPSSTPAPCQVSLEPTSLQEHCPVSSTTHISTATPPVLSIDKDKLLREKDKQIEQLTRMLKQKQKLVDALKTQLEHGMIGGRAQDPLLLVRVKQEAPEKPSVPLLYGHPLSPRSPSCKTNLAKVTVKQKAPEAEDNMSETTLRSPDSEIQFLTPEVQRQVLLQIEPWQPNAKSREDICLQQTSVQLAQQQATEKLLLQKQHNIQKRQQMFQTKTTKQNLQKRSQQRKQISHRQQKLQPHEQLKQQGPRKQQTPPLVKLTQPQKIQIQINLNQQQVLIQKKPRMEQQSSQVSQASLKKQPGAAPSLRKSDTTPTLVTDGNSNHFLIALTSHVPERQRANAPMRCLQDEDIILQSENVEIQSSVDQQQGATAPPGLEPLFKHQETVPSGKNPASLSSHTETDREDDFSATSLQTAGMPDTSKLAPDLSLDYLYPNSPASSPPPFPFQLLLSAPSCDSTHQALLVQSETERLVDSTEEKQHRSSVENGRLEDFLESTTGKPLLGVEPGGLLALIDDLHNQMLCSPSILDRPPSPADTVDRLAEVQQGLNINDWLDLTMGGQPDEEIPTSGPQKRCGIFSTDFLDSCLIL